MADLETPARDENDTATGSAQGAVLWSTFEYSSGRAGLTGIGARMEDGPGQSEEER
jgi:hypothetical protein